MPQPETPPAARYRWLILAAGTFAQATFAVLLFGLAVLAPAIRARFGLSLTEVGILLASPGLGQIATVYLWGLTTDRVGERAVITVGLILCGAFIVGAAFAGSFLVLTVLAVLSGASGACVNAASGRVVMHWFDRSQRGLALGVRQTAAPIGAACAALLLPPLASGDDPRLGLLVIAVGLFAGALVGLVVVREGPVAESMRAQTSSRSVLRNRSMWRLSLGSGLLMAPQMCLLGFLVLFLHERRHVSTASAGAVLAATNIIGIATRVAVGRWSDLAGSRIGPLRRIALASGLLVAGCAALLGAPLAVLLPLLILTGAVAISWNGLSFAAAAEAVGHGRSGSAIGLQQTVLALSSVVLPIAFGSLVAWTSWRVGFVVVAAFPLAGWRLLERVPG